MKKFLKLFSIAVIAVIIIGVIISFSSNQNSQNSTVQPVSTSTSISIGDNVILDEGVSTAKVVIVATTQANLDEIIKLSNAGDDLGIAKMIVDGYAFMVDRGTQARIIDTAMYVRKVRIMSGDYYGESGWVPFEFCKK
jgi:hypothetical protein